MSEGIEIERKFVPESLPDLSRYSSKRIEQGYLSTDPVVRVRKEDDDYYLTYKNRGLMARTEYNLPLNEGSYYHLKDKCDGTVIEKTRYLIPLDGIYEGLTVELDIFDGALKGLVLAEVEFESEDQAKSFVQPDWLGRDVTEDTRYHNSNMSKPGYVIPV